MSVENVRITFLFHIYKDFKVIQKVNVFSGLVDIDERKVYHGYC